MEPIGLKRRRRRGKRGGKRARAIGVANPSHGRLSAPVNSANRPSSSSSGSDRPFLARFGSNNTQEVRIPGYVPWAGTGAGAAAMGASDDVEPYVPEFVVAPPQFGAQFAPIHQSGFRFGGFSVNGNGPGPIAQPFFSLDDLPEFVYPTDMTYAY